MGGQGHVAIEALRGEIGTSCMRVRDMKAKLKYARSAMNGELGSLVKNVLEDMYNKENDEYIRTLNKYMNCIGIERVSDLSEITEYRLEQLIKEKDTAEWRAAMDQKSTLYLYREYKKRIMQESFYDNTWGSTLMFRARSNSLKLNWRRRFQGGDVGCEMCNDGEETLNHFMIECRGYEILKMQHGMTDKTIEQMLLLVTGCDPQLAKNYLVAIWKHRKNNIVN